jgi:hypothetical protein
MKSKKKLSWPNFKVLVQNLAESTKEHHKKPLSGWQFSVPRFEPRPSRILSKSVHDLRQGNLTD